MQGDPYQRDQQNASRGCTGRISPFRGSDCPIWYQRPLSIVSAAMDVASCGECPCYFELLSDVALPRLERLVFLGIARATMPLFLSRTRTYLRCAIFNRFFAVAPPALVLRSL